MLLPIEVLPFEVLDGIRHRERRRFVARRRWRSVVTTAAILLAAIGANHTADVMANIRVEEQAYARIDDLGAPADERNVDSALVFLTGVGTNNADTFAKYQHTAFQQLVDGRVWSVNYRNAALDAAAIGDAIRAKARRDGVERVSIIGRSAGGIVATQVVQDILDHSHLAVELLALESVPDGLDGVRPSEIRSMQLAEYLTLIPGAEHSTAIRVALEVALRHEQYGWDPFAFARTVGEVQDSVEQGRLPGSWLVVDQVLAIGEARFDQRLADIGGADDGQQRPVVLYFGTSAPGYDPQVNDARSGEAICGYARSAGLHCLDIGVPGAVHSRPDLAIDAYEQKTAFVAPVVHGWIADEHTRVAMERFDIPTRVGIG